MRSEQCVRFCLFRRHCLLIMLYVVETEIYWIKDDIKIWRRKSIDRYGPRPISNVGHLAYLLSLQTTLLKKMQSINLLFSSIERKLVMLVEKKSSCHINIKFKLNLKIWALLLITHKLRLSVKFCEKLICTCNYADSALVKY
jgi:hypothetical protein